VLCKKQKQKGQEKKKKEGEGFLHNDQKNSVILDIPEVLYALLAAVSQTMLASVHVPGCGLRFGRPALL
jgi:hypothetical protein